MQAHVFGCRALGLVLVFVLLPVVGCKAVEQTAGIGANNANVGQSLQQPQGTLTRKELSQKLRRLAMSYLGEVPEACETIAANEGSLDRRLLALSIRVNSADSVISIAADPDPQVSLLNMVTVLTLQRMLAEERAAEFFGERGQLYIDAARRMEAEAWKLAEQAMDQDERTQLGNLILQYRMDHPNEVYVWWVRFSEFSAYKEQFSIASVGQSIVDVFVPVGGAVAGIESTTDVAERATWLAARQALILQWRVELTYLRTLAAPETARLLADVEKVSSTIDALPERIKAEREAILKALDEQEGQLREVIGDARLAIGDAKDTVTEARATVGEIEQTINTARAAVGDIQDTLTQADQSIANGVQAVNDAKQVLPEAEKTLAQLEQTSASLNTTIQSLDQFTRQFDSDPDAPPSRPFDITEYTAALQEATKTLEQLNTLAGTVDRTAEPTRLDATLDSLEGRFSALIWQAGFILVAAGVLIVLAAKYIPSRRGSVGART